MPNRPMIVLAGRPSASLGEGINSLINYRDNQRQQAFSNNLATSKLAMRQKEHDLAIQNARASAAAKDSAQRAQEHLRGLFPVKRMLESGNVDGAKAMLTARVGELDRLAQGGANVRSDESRALLAAIDGGDVQGALGLINDEFTAAERFGILQPGPKPVAKFEAVTDANGNIVGQRNTVTGEVKSHPGAAKPNQLTSLFSQAGIDPNSPEAQNIARRILSNKGAPPRTINNVTVNTKGNEALDKAFAKDLADFGPGGGFADVQKNIAQLKEVSDALGKKGASLSGPWIGLVPDTALAFANPEALDARQAVEEVVQRNLRLVLGAQFTEKEGERLIARAFNPKLDEEKNKKRLDRLIRQMEIAADTKRKAAMYFNENGTLVGFPLRLPTINDFYRSVEQGSKTTIGRFTVEGAD